VLTGEKGEGRRQSWWPPISSCEIERYVQGGEMRKTNGKQAFLKKKYSNFEVTSKNLASKRK